MKQEFLELFSEVIAENNTIHMCGREKCEDLIALADALEPGVPHGSRHSGFVNANAMRNLKNKLENET